MTSPSTVILFLLTPLREGRRKRPTQNPYPSRFLLTPLREGRHKTTFCLLVLSNFYSRPCGRGDGVVLFDCVRRIDDFYSRPCGRGDARRAILRSRRRDFYSRPCGRGDMNCNTTRSHPLYFYSRPCGRGDIVRHAVYPIGRNFYSRPCGRGDWIFRPSSVSLSEISTHAPAGGATLRLHLAGAEGAISTHAPAGGATQLCVSRVIAFAFLLTPLREGRLDHVRQLVGAETISTHAPAGGATRRHNRNRNVAPISTHAPAGGATPQLDAASEIGIISTHAPAGGATIKTIACGTAQKVFLLTPLREGRPGGMWRKRHGTTISTHAPAGGATPAAGRGR